MKQPSSNEEWYQYKFGVDRVRCIELDTKSMGKKPICTVCGYPWVQHSDHHCSHLAENMDMDWESAEFAPYDMPDVSPIVRLEVHTLPYKSTVKDVFNE